jgi:thiol-disulfide isomerase/thioredoxin
MKKTTPLYALVAALALAAGSAAAWWRISPVSTAQAAEVQPKLWDASFKDLDGKPHALKTWQGKPLVVNFWATWCGPCKEEMPDFEASSKAVAGRVNFVGIAVDNPASVKEFVQKLGVDYPILVGEQDALDLMKAEGDRIGVLPFTIIFDKDGKKVVVQVGHITRDKLDAYLAPLLKG